MICGLIVILTHYIYYKSTNLDIYRSIPLNTLNGVLRYVMMFVLIMVISKGIELLLKNMIPTYRTF